MAAFDGEEGLGPEVAGDGAPATLVEALQAGIVPWPGMLSWNQWQVWRRGEGRRPPVDQHLRGPTVRREARLWREVMAAAVQRIPVETLSDDVDDPDFAEEPAGADPVRAGAALTPWAPSPGRAAQRLPSGVPGAAAAAGDEGSDVSEGSWRGLATEEARAKLLTDFDPVSETLQTFQQRLFRAASVLEARGAPADEAVLRKAVLRARYFMETAGMADQEAVRFFRRQLGQLLEQDGEEQEQELRVNVLLELSQERAAGEAGGLLAALFGRERRPRGVARAAARARRPCQGGLLGLLQSGASSEGPRQGRVAVQVAGGRRGRGPMPRRCRRGRARPCKGLVRRVAPCARHCRPDRAVRRPAAEAPPPPVGWSGLSRR